MFPFSFISTVTSRIYGLVTYILGFIVRRVMASNDNGIAIKDVPEPTERDDQGVLREDSTAACLRTVNEAETAAEPDVVGEVANWAEEKDIISGLALNEKRKRYSCGEKNYTSLANVQNWADYFNVNVRQKKLLGGKLCNILDINEAANNRVSIWRGDITTLEIDVIVNAAKKSLLGGGGVDGAIHRAAGDFLVQECETLHGCETGEAKITGGYNLPAKYVVHTVGPVGGGDDALRNCYENSLRLMLENGLRSIAFPCISTGIYGFPNERAADIVLSATRNFIENNTDNVDRVIFCLFMPLDVEIYERLMQKYFPVCPEDPRPVADSPVILPDVPAELPQKDTETNENPTSVPTELADTMDAVSPEIVVTVCEQSPTTCESTTEIVNESPIIAEPATEKVEPVKNEADSAEEKTVISEQTDTSQIIPENDAADGKNLECETKPEEVETVANEDATNADQGTVSTEQIQTDTNGSEDSFEKLQLPPPHSGSEVEIDKEEFGNVKPDEQKPDVTERSPHVAGEDIPYEDQVTIPENENSKI